METAAVRTVVDAGALESDADALIEQSRARAAGRLGDRDRLISVAIAGSFVAAATVLALLPSSRSPGILAVGALIAAYAVAARVEFEVGTGIAAPTQVVLVPMLFLLPVGLVPAAVAAGLVAGRADELRRGGAERGLLLVSSSWNAVGPTVVFLAAGEPNPDLADWPLYLGALVAQFAVDLVVSGVRGSVALGLPIRTQVRFMSWVYLVDVCLAPVGLLAALAAMRGGAAVALVLPVIGLMAVFARERRARIDHALELGQAYRGTAFLLGDVVEADDEYTGAHSREVVDLALAVADEIELPARERRTVEFVALLHDVGKIRIPTEIINKPGPLTPEERAVVELHTVEGERMLSGVGGLLSEVGRVVRCCHERYDGTGYPDGLAGDAIPLVARIVACCDAFSAMTSNRPYRAALRRDEALAELHVNAGTQFDPDVVRVLSDVIARSDA